LKVLIGQGDLVSFPPTGPTLIVDTRTGMVERSVVLDHVSSTRLGSYNARMVVTSTGTRVLYFGGDNRLYVIRC
jgi:hypothetical protein